MIKYESVIHEFDPYFNYRVTRFLSEKGFYDTWDFFDSFTWYPLGRVVGGTMYPGARRRWRVHVWVYLCLCLHLEAVNCSSSAGSTAQEGPHVDWSTKAAIVGS